MEYLRVISERARCPLLYETPVLRVFCTTALLIAALLIMLGRSTWRE
jgi:hypothetical protein